MKHDKKTRNGVMHFVLARSIGDTFVHGEVPEQIVTAVLERGCDAV
jgi:3-dehydroquinate synthetase